MASIAELGADELAKHAFNIFLTQGRHIEGARVIFQALKLQPNHPLALRCLSDFHDKEGSEQFSAVVLEYALSSVCGIHGVQRGEFDELRFLSIWSWGFSKHKSGAANLDGAAFKDRQSFLFDETGYKSFVDGLVQKAGSLELAYLATHRLTGVMAGFLKHADKASPTMEDIFDSKQFLESDSYVVWLQSQDDKFLALDRSIQDMRKAQTSE